MENENLDNNLKKDSTAHLNIYSLVERLDLDIWLILGLILITNLSIYTPPINTTPFRFVMGLVMVMLLPGYALLIVIFPAGKEITIAERLVLSVVLSIIITPLLGFALNFTSWGIYLDGMVISISAFVLLCSAAAVLRRRDLPVENHTNAIKQISEILTGIFPTPDRKLDRILTFFALISVLLMTGVVAYFVITPMPGENFTEFYILGPEGKAANYSTNFTIGDEKPIIVGISNHELRIVTYDLAIAISNGNNTSTLYNEQLILSDNQTMEKQILLKPDLVGNGMKLEFMLYKDGNTTSPYRELYLWVNVTGTENKYPGPYPEYANII